MQWFLDGRQNYKGPVVELVGEGDEAIYAADDIDDKIGGAAGGRGDGDGSARVGNGTVVS